MTNPASPTQPPLDWRAPIVTPDGRPTSSFQRMWDSQRQVNSGIPDPNAFDTKGSAATALATAEAYTDSAITALAPELLPIGGTTGQVLTKASNADFDVDWETPTGGGGGGGQPTTAYWDFKISASWVIVFPDWFTAANSAPSSNWVTILASQPKTASKWYAEIKLLNFGASNPGIGIFPPGGSLTTFVGDTLNGWCIAANGNVFAGSGGTPTNGSAYAAGDIIGITVDFTGGAIAFYKNNVANGGITGITFSGSYRLAFSAINYPVMTTLSTTSGNCTYSPPAGFTNWN